MSKNAFVAFTLLSLIVACGDDSGPAMAGNGAFPASGQTQSYGTASDGHQPFGAPLWFTDNEDGTVTDNNTGLTWEKKDRSGGIHDVDRAYSWGLASAPYTMNGTIISFLDQLNTRPCFAGHCDWRIPNVKELQSIIDYDVFEPSVSSAFHSENGCIDCRDATAPHCTCTASTYYWSSTTVQNFPENAWIVTFYNGFVGHDAKNATFPVRAVRGGR